MRGWRCRPPSSSPSSFRWWKSIAKDFNGGSFPADSATLLALNFLPGSYKAHGAQHDPDAAIAGAAGPYAADYHDNIGLDPHRIGKISVNTIGDYLANVASQGGSRWAAIQTGIHDALARRAVTPPAPTPIPPQPPPPLPPPSPKRRGGAIALLMFALGGAAYAFWRK